MLKLITDLPLAWVRGGIEVTAVILGWLLGGVVGVGTLLFALGTAGLCGPLKTA